MTTTTERLCPDCGAQVDSPHFEMCDVARCLVTGHQRLSCFDGAVEGHDCGKDVWTGEWPGTAECHEYGLWARLIPGKGWQPCNADTEGASEDLNTLYGSGRFQWDR